jgi:hypothetical protein
MTNNECQKTKPASRVPPAASAPLSLVIRHCVLFALLPATGPPPFSNRMHVSFNLAADLDTALKSAATAAGLADASAFAPEVRTADPKHGDFQANGTLGYAKARKLNPRAIGRAARRRPPRRGA